MKVTVQALTARFNGRCPDCGGWISAGDPIKMGEDGAVHAPSCPPDPDAPIHPVCTTCWLTHPVGACDRD